MDYQLFPKLNIAKYRVRYHTGCTGQRFSALFFVLMVFAVHSLERECNDSVHLKGFMKTMTFEIQFKRRM